jgi:hypothetical protein
LTRDEAVAISTWTYEPPYDVYNAPGEEAVATFFARDTGEFAGPADRQFLELSC